MNLILLATHPRLLLGWLLLSSAGLSSATAQSAPRLLTENRSLRQVATQSAMVALPDVIQQLEETYQIKINYRNSVVEQRNLTATQATQLLSLEPGSLVRQANQTLRAAGLQLKHYREEYYTLVPYTPARLPGKVEGQRPTSAVLSPVIRQTVYQTVAVDKTITGQVTDLSTDEGLPGVNIVVKGTTVGTVTDIDGNYRLTAPDDAETLVFSSVGYMSEEVAIDNRTTINLEMAPDIQSLSEVVVVGYGTQRKRDLTGSVSKIEGDQLENLPTPRVDQLLQGRAPGVNVTSVSGAPGARASIRIRGGNSIQGDNEPLYVIDGFIAGTNFNLNNLNVNDIESIDILKDASAISIYGTRGANGVILITTKSGAGAGEGPPSVSVNAYTGVQTLARKIDYLNGPERAAYGSELADFNGESNPFVDESLIADTDWEDLITRSAPTTNVDLSVRGSTDHVNYYLSGNYLDQRGIIENSGFKRYNVRANLDFKIASWATLGTRINATYSEDDNNLVDLSASLRTLTSFPAYESDGSFWSENYVQGGPLANPLADLAFSENQSLGTNLLGNFYLELQPIEGLTLRSTIGPQLDWVKNNRFFSGQLPERAASRVGGEARLQNAFNVEILQENTITYDKKINENHRFNVLGGFTWQTARTEVFRAETQGLPNDGVTYNLLEIGDPETFRVVSRLNDPFQIVSWIGRANYTLMDKYLFTVAGRVDGSSRFSGADNQYAFFPSAAVAWRLGDEAFIQNLGVFDDLKLRASYGVSGSQAIGAYSTRATLSPDVVIFNGTQNTAVRRARPDNPNLRWETTEQLDIGLEAGFFQNRLTLELDYYRKKTVDLLLNRQIAQQTGFDERLENVGSLQNQGLELMINSVNVAQDNFQWSTTLTLAGNRSRVLDLGGVDQIDIYRLSQRGPAARLIVGEPVGTFSGLAYLGTWKTQTEVDEAGYDGLRTVVGGPRFQDVNDDGQITFIDDFMTIGNPEPTVYGGLNNSFRYKNFTLDVFLQGTYGNDVYNEAALTSFFGISSANLYREALNRWSESNPTSDIPRAGGVASVADVPSNDAVVEDGSHLRLRNVRLAYRVPTGSDSWLDNLSVYVTGNNLFLWSNFRGYDPESTGIGPGSNQEFRSVIRGVIQIEYPNARTFTVGLNANF